MSRWETDSQGWRELTPKTFHFLNSELAELWVGDDPGGGGDGGQDQAHHGDLPGCRVLCQLELSPDEERDHRQDHQVEEDGEEPGRETKRLKFEITINYLGQGCERG